MKIYFKITEKLLDTIAKMNVIVLVCCFFALVTGRGLKEEFTWTRLSYVRYSDARFGYHGGPKPLPDNQPDSNLVNNDDYNYENNIPMGANRWKDKLFITVPRRRAGVPATLSYVPVNSTQKHNAPLIPYPDWDVNQLRTGKLVSIYRVAVDPCDRLWMVDTGLIEIPGNNTRLSPDRLIIIDLNTDQIIHEYTFTESDLKPATSLASVTVDVTPGSCGDAFAYFPDLAGYGLIVYSLKENKSWRVTHNYFYFEPQGGDFFIGGQNFQWNDGVFSITLSATKPNGFRTAYFHPMAGTNLYSVSTEILKNEALATRSFHKNDFMIEGDRGSKSQTSSSGLHQQSGILFLGLINQNALGCWNTKKDFRLENFDIIHRDNRKMIYPSDVKVVGNEIMMLTNTMPVFLYDRLDYTKINFRVWSATIDDAVRGTSCR